MREVIKLREAERLKGWPEIIPRSRVRGVKVLGRRYEVAVGRQLGPQARRGVWWRYQDINGPGLCQTDFLIEGEFWVVILEAKHSWTVEGMSQLRNYKPVVEMATGKRTIGIQVCKHLTPAVTGPIYNSLAEAAHAARQGDRVGYGHESPSRLVTLHWRGVGPILYGANERSVCSVYL